MKKSPVIIVLIFALMSSCNDQSTQPISADVKTVVSADACYLYSTDKDTVSLQITAAADLVSGTLTYRLYAKDRNDGTIQGRMKEDTLYADYRFSSEGMESTREVVFLRKDNILTEGYGEMMEKDGKMAFKNRQEITFGNGIVLQKTECKK